MNVDTLTDLIKILDEKKLAAYVKTDEFYFRPDGVFDSKVGGIRMIPDETHIDSTYRYIREEIIKPHIINTMVNEQIRDWMKEKL